jgi:hypothetical protein
MNNQLLKVPHSFIQKNADASGINGWRSMIPGVSDMVSDTFMG